MQNFRVTDIQSLFNHRSEASKSRSAERRVRDGLGSFSDHSRIMFGIRVFTCFYFVAGAALCGSPCADFVAGAALCGSPCADLVAGAALCGSPCADCVAGAALCEPPCAEIVNARNAVFFNGTDGFEAGKSRSAERRVGIIRSFSEHHWNWRFHFCLEVKTSWQVQIRINNIMRIMERITTFN